MLSLLLRLLPLIALSAFAAADDNDDAADQEEADDDGDNDDDKDEAKFTQSDVEAIIARRLNRERKKIEKDLADEIRQQIKDEAEREAAEEAEEFRPLYETEKEKREAAERRVDEIEDVWKKRLVRAEIRVAAAELGFRDAADAQALIDLDEVSYDDDGEPTNIGKLVKGLAEKRPYLIQSDDKRTKPVEHSRANGKPASSESIRDNYLKQAGVTPPRT